MQQLLQNAGRQHHPGAACRKKSKPNSTFGAKHHAVQLTFSRHAASLTQRHHCGGHVQARPKEEELPPPNAGGFEAGHAPGQPDLGGLIEGV